MTNHAQTADALSHNADAIVGIVVALPEELRTLTRKKLEQGQCCRVGNTWVAYSGAGTVNAGKAARLLIDKGAQKLMSWGCAAGLTNDLRPGALVLAEQVIGEQRQFDTDAHWRNAIRHSLESSISISKGSLFTSTALVSRSQDKQHIRQTSQAVALDMESAAIAEAAAQANLPFLVIRSVADPVTMDLPQAVLAGLNDKGQVELPELLRYLLCHPWEVIGLIKLGLHFHAAQKTLKTVAKHLGIGDNQAAPLAN